MWLIQRIISIYIHFTVIHAWKMLDPVQACWVDNMVAIFWTVICHSELKFLSGTWFKVVTTYLYNKLRCYSSIIKL